MNKFLKLKYPLLLIVIVLIAFFAFRKTAAKEELLKLGVGRVERMDLIQRVTLSGVVEPKRKSIITAPYKGYVKKIFVTLGDNIKAGDPVASVGTTLTLNDQVFPLRAPFSGKVVQVNKDEGEFVKESDTTDFIARIDDISEMYINAVVPEIDRLKIKVGQEALVKFSAILDKSYKAKVLELSLAAKDRDRWERSTVIEFPLRLKIIDADENVKSGMSVIMDIITLKKEKVLTLRHEFIQLKGDRHFVTLENDQTRDIKIGSQNEEVSEVVEGLNEGDLVKKIKFSETGKK